MADQQEEQRLPLYYQSLMPLSTSQHGGFQLKERANHPFAVKSHAIPVTVDEFVMVQRHYPIVFGPGETAAPLALVGMSEGENLFVDGDGNWAADVYVPAYVRRYPFMLAKLTPEADQLSLCFDDQSGYVGTDVGGNALFGGDKPTELTQNVLKFCEQFEQAVARTRAFMQELNALELLEDGEAQIGMQGAQPATFRGFRMIGEKKLQEIDTEKAAKLVQSGALGLMYAHLFSLSHMRELFARRQRKQAMN